MKDDLVRYPAALPMPQLSNQRTNHVSPLMRTQLASGRARQRRRFTSVPSIKSVSWKMNQAQAQLFEVWFSAGREYGGITDGADWFLCRLRTPMGIRDYQCRFTDIYSGPNELGFFLYEFSAQLELIERPLLPPGETQFPDEIIYGSLFDRTMNQHWPEA